MVPTSPVGPHPPPPYPGGSNSPQHRFFSDAVEVDPDNILPDTIRNQFCEVLRTHDEVFNPAIELIANWSRILDALARRWGLPDKEPCDQIQPNIVVVLGHMTVRLSATKTVICPKTTTILGWIWSQGSLSGSPHRIAALATCSPPESVKGMRSFIGAYKVLSRVLPHCSQLVDPLESSLANLQSHDHVQWDDNLRQKFTAAQDALNTHKSIVLPRASDQLWTVTDGSVTRRGLGATLYVTRQDRLLLAGFFSSKLRKHQVTWLPCEVEALSIAAAVKDFSPFII